MDNKGTEAIAVWLNNYGIPSPNGTVWHNNAIKRLLVHEFHLGKVVYGKNKWKKDRDGKKRIVSKRDESEWDTGQEKGAEPRKSTFKAEESRIRGT